MKALNGTRAETEPYEAMRRFSEKEIWLGRLFGVVGAVPLAYLVGETTTQRIMLYVVFVVGVFLLQSKTT